MPNTLFQVLVIAVITVVWTSSIFSMPELAFYGPDDKLVVLNRSTVVEVMFHSDKAWLVQFYADWCPYSEQFAPNYKLLAQEISGWQNVIVLAVFNCGGKSNKRLCRQFRVKGYPSLRFFPPNSSEVGTYKNNTSINRGRKIKPGDLLEIKQKLMNLMKPHFPNLLSSNNYSNGSVNRAMNGELSSSSETEFLGPISSRSMVSHGQDEIPKHITIGDKGQVDSGSQAVQGGTGNERTLESASNEKMCP